MKKIKVLLALIGITLLGNSVALGSNRSGAVTFSPMYGYYYFASKRRNTHDVATPGIAIAYDFAPCLALEAAWASVNPRHSRHHDHDSDDVTNPFVYQNPNPHRGKQGNLYVLDGIFRFGSFSVIEPYVSLGLGVLSIKYNGNDATNQANANAALGTQIFIDPSIAFRAEVRDLYTFVGGKNDVMVNAGMSFLFGGETPRYKPVSYKGRRGEG